MRGGSPDLGGAEVSEGAPEGGKSKTGGEANANLRLAKPGSRKTTDTLVLSWPG